MLAIGILLLLGGSEPPCRAPALQLDEAAADIEFELKLANLLS